MILIAESGSTKTEWCTLTEGKTPYKFLTDGINPLLHSEETVRRNIKNQLPDIFLNNKYEYIAFYGAGCISENHKNIIRNILAECFNTRVFVENDLLAAARSLFNDKPGIACILGTGSNSCLYDGKSIIQNVKPLGYILGDEGSGSALGKAFLSDYLKNLVPSALASQFHEYCKLSYEEIMAKVYKNESPSRFLASTSLFLYQHKQEEYIYNLVYSNFTQFLERAVKQYPYKEYPIGFTGSVAYYYNDILHDVFQDSDIAIKSIIKSPMEGLISYHSSCIAETSI